MVRLRTRATIAGIIITATLVSSAASISPRPITRLHTSVVPRVEILWDTWGVPHIWAKDNQALFWAFGWAQMHNHANALLRLFGKARGRAAEYWGEKYLASDRSVRLFDLGREARGWYASETPEFRLYLNMFAAGINAYGRAHADSISPALRIVLPVSALDVLALVEGDLLQFLVTNNRPCASELGNAGYGGFAYGAPALLGSNAWAIGPAYSASHRAMLLVNPHLGWGPPLLWNEAQLVAPQMNAYGAAIIGSPVLNIAFNDFLGWSHTNNTIDSCDAYRLKLAPGGFVYDNLVRPFAITTDIIKIRSPSGGFRLERFVVRRSVFGPVAFSGRIATAIRVVAYDRFPAYGALREWWDLAHARKLSEFNDVLSRLQVPMFNVLYADRDGHIMYVFNGQAPVHAFGDYHDWFDAMPGVRSQFLWTKLYEYRDLPKIIDPPSGWLQNANGPPWFATVPPQLDYHRFPLDLAPNTLTFREQRAIKMLQRDYPLSFNQMIADKLSTRSELADRLLDSLFAAARPGASFDPILRRAVDVLAHWDRSFEPSSRGAVLFVEWVNRMRIDFPSSTKGFAHGWDEHQPLRTPNGLAHPLVAVAELRIAANKTRENFGSIDVTWGAAMRFRRGAVNLPARGAWGDPLGVFRALGFSKAKDGVWEADGGDSYIAAIEFSNPVRAKVLVTYGSSSQPRSLHNGDQLQLYARNELRDAWRTRAEVEAHLERREVFTTLR